jgi:hypothetical protein
VKLPIGTYSFYNQLQQCPHKASHVYVLRTVPYVESPEMKWGNDVHKAMENRIRHGSPLPDTMAVAEPTAANFHRISQMLPVQAEYQLAMTRDGTPCDWTDKGCFFRGKLDLVTMNSIRTYAWMVDWKTGNVREEPFELECGALLLKVNQPSLEQITGEYFWMKTGQNGLRYTFNNHGNTFERLVKLRTEAEDYLHTGVWPKRKTPLCHWCPVSTCEHFTGGKGR